ncbi:imidazolonepropionase [Saprolegnia diclina VS20]|uniref:Probable imidazolonepropionase n=1 Tax=Saprolegnia diclina (strain VS20) TaxID=1156394 RepID=T0QVB3_SAPDV|nr:imidazolonepropionase [Saprolegnia diclina VS20]EQC38606.1 imidazolonepropionase [Saprolegnia diclina VS20]|eukprot:XP_008608198.1 imidazolonepropionase [Saprolegnia diclina VS20]
MSSFRLRIRNARQLVQVCANGETAKVGPAQDDVAIIEDGAVIVDNEGRIAAVGTTASVDAWVAAQSQPVTFAKDFDATGLCVLPGLVDGHTHPVWSGSRVDEFAMKLAGATYMEVHAMGGGIGRTVRCTKASSETELSELLMKRLDRMLKCGTTLAEAKSGYGLETETEIKMLKVLHKASQAHTIDLVATYLGGHSVPEGMSAAEATEDIVRKQIPAIIEAKKAGLVNPEFIDVFCEKGVFEYDDTKTILEAGAAAGMKINFHGDELNPMDSGKLCMCVQAHAASHLEMLDTANIAAMKQASTYAVLLPTTMYILKLQSPPARELIAHGVPVALGSDYNPNAHCLSMPLTMHMACCLMKMTMKEALVGATINAAGSANRASTHGSIEVGKFGDLVVLDAPQWEHIIYEMADPPIQHVIKNGHFVVSHNQKLA